MKMRQNESQRDHWQELEAEWRSHPYTRLLERVNETRRKVLIHELQSMNAADAGGLAAALNVRQLQSHMQLTNYEQSILLAVLGELQTEVVKDEQ